METNSIRDMSKNSNFVPSPLVATELKKHAKYGIPQRIAEGVLLVLADNAKDYTGPGTNTYIVGEGRVCVFDPGPNDKTHIDAVLDAIGGRPVDGIFITHTHLDHSPAATPLARITGAKTYGFGTLSKEILAFTDEDIDEDFIPDVALACGGLIGEGDWQVMAIHTPGHFPNHLCYALPHKGMLLSGDHVMGWSTTVVVPPLGNLKEYLESLDKLEAGGARLMLPSHGPIVEDSVGRIRAVRDHRMMRHRQIAACVAAGIHAPVDIVAQIYEGLTVRLMEAARGCVEAHLELLAEEAGSISSGYDATRPHLES